MSVLCCHDKILNKTGQKNRTDILVKGDSFFMEKRESDSFHSHSDL